MKIITVIGARPHFIKAAVLSRKLKNTHKEIIVHTGQHYDYNMSQVFFEELGIPEPKYNLGVGSEVYGKQIGKMLIGLEEIYEQEKPDLVLVYGDTNSTLAGAIGAAKRDIPIAHVEAGLRSYNKSISEEQNRMLTDYLSQYLFVPVESAIDNLRREGITKGVYNTGDIMLDAINLFGEIADRKTDIMERLQLQSQQYLLATIHRIENTDNVEKLKRIIQALNESYIRTVLPLHPRTKKIINLNNIQIADHISVIEPVSYLEMVKLEKECLKIVTDSGGVQREAYFLGKPGIIVKSETEGTEMIDSGWTLIVGSDTERIIDAVKNFAPHTPRPPIFGDGKAAEKMCRVLDNIN